MGYWPFWLGAAGLAGVTLAYFATVRRPLGVSGVLGVLLDRESPRRTTDEHALSGVDLEAMLRAATARAFGDQAVADAGAAPAPAAAPTAPAPSLGRRLTWWESVAFAVAVVAGGAISAGISGRTPTVELDPAYASLLGGGELGLVIMFVGGVMVGFGTQMGGGCTSGHGLVGCGTLQPGSLVGTAMFFGTAVVTSFVLAGIAS